MKGRKTGVQLLMFCVVALVAGSIAPALAQGAGAVSGGGGLIPPWALRASLTWAVCAALLSTVYLKGILPSMARVQGRRKIDTGKGWASPPRSSAFATLRWKDDEQAADWLLAGDQMGTLHVMNRQTGRTRTAFRVEEMRSAPITCLAVCPRTGHIAVPAGIGNDLHLYRTTDILRASPGKEPMAIRVRRDEIGIVTALAFSSSGAELAVGSSTGSISRYKTDRQKDAMGGSAETIYGHQGAVLSLVFQPGNDRVLVSGGKDHSLRLWGRKPGGELLAQFADQTDEVHSLAFRADGRRLAAAVGNSLVVYAVGDDHCTVQSTLHHAFVKMVAWVGAHITCVSEQQGMIWNLDAGSAATGTARGSQVARTDNGAETGTPLLHGGVFVQATHNDTALLIVGRDIESHRDNVVWELPLSQATVENLPEDPEPVTLAPLLSAAGPGGPAAVRNAVRQEPSYPRNEPKPRRPMPLSHKVGVAVSLLLAMAPAYVAGPLTATPRAQSLASADATQKPRSLSAVEFQPLRTFVRDAERRMKSAQGAPKNKARALWLKARSTAELVDNAEWLRRAQQENEALKQGRPPTSSETLNDVAQSRFIVARASYALGDAAGSTQAVREIVARYMEARIDAPDGTPKPVKELLEQELKPIYMRIIQSANTKGGNRGTRR